MSGLLISNNNFHPLSLTDSNMIENSWSGFGLTPDLPRREMSILSSRPPSSSSSESMDSISTIIDQGSRQGNSITAGQIILKSPGKKTREIKINQFLFLVKLHFWQF